MKKILFYCQYLAGMGHLVRSSEIIRCLVKDFQVCLVIGGEPIPDYALPNTTKVVYLPTLREEQGLLIAPEQQLDAVKQDRTQQLLNIFDDFQPDCVITECFPFSKYKMAFELLPLVQRAKADQVKVVCSLRDLIMTQPMTPQGRERKQARILAQIGEYYDLILYHCDRNLRPLEFCFPRAAALPCEVFYTGYVAQSEIEQPLTPEDAASLATPTPKIIASVGGGRDGYPLLHAVIAANAHLQSLPHQIYAFAGPFMPTEQFLELQQLAATQPKVTLRRFTPHLLNYLTQAELSISFGGYNTTMNLLRAGVRALIAPSPSVDQADEQRIRANQLAAHGLVNVLPLTGLDPEALAQTITQQLEQPRPQYPINLQGAENTALRLKQLLQAQLIAA